MGLGIFNELANNLKESLNKNKVAQNFVNELGEYLEKNISEKLGDLSNLNTEKMGILEQIETQRKVSRVSRNTMKNRMSEVLGEYAKQTAQKGEMCFVVSKKNENYTIFKYVGGNEKIEKIEKIEKNIMPSNAGVNSVLRIENGEYKLDEEDTINVQNEITKMANEILERQDEKLNQFRKEGHLYMVEEDRLNEIYLTDITDKTENEVLEEVDFPNELISEAGEGTIFQYQDGQYHFYSREGIEGRSLKILVLEH